MGLFENLNGGVKFLIITSFIIVMAMIAKVYIKRKTLRTYEVLCEEASKLHILEVFQREVEYLSTIYPVTIDTVVLRKAFKHAIFIGERDGLIPEKKQNLSSTYKDNVVSFKRDKQS